MYVLGAADYGPDLNLTLDSSGSSDTPPAKESPAGGSQGSGSLDLTGLTDQQKADVAAEMASGNYAGAAAIVAAAKAKGTNWLMIGAVAAVAAFLFIKQ
jgi:hypothetical protein